MYTNVSIRACGLGGGDPQWACGRHTGAPNLLAGPLFSEPLFAWLLVWLSNLVSPPLESSMGGWFLPLANLTLAVSKPHFPLYKKSGVLRPPDESSACARAVVRRG